LLGTVEDWTSGVPFEAAVERIDPTRSNPYVQANAGGFHADVVQITAEEYDIVTTSSCRCGTGREASLSNRSCDSNTARRARPSADGLTISQSLLALADAGPKQVRKRPLERIAIDRNGPAPPVPGIGKQA
jgi:hypothetical protein